MNKNTLLDYLKDHYRKQDEAQLLMENQIDNEILEEAKSKLRKKKNETK